MQYRKLGNTDIDVSVLGFGCMRFPVPEGDYGDVPPPERPVNEPEAVEMLEYAIDKGVNYFDTAYVYHGGRSEEILGRVAKPHRDKLMIATKLPTFILEGPDDFERIFTEQLKRLDTDYIDFYLLHNLNQRIWPVMKEWGALEFMDRLLSEGRARHIGFSFHDDTKTFKEIIDSHDWTMAQIQYNYFDENRQAGRAGLEYAANKGMGIVIMEPLRGGSLTNKVPYDIQAIWDSSEIKRTPAEWGLRWVWNHPEVSLLLSGMSTMDQVVENIEIAETIGAGALSDAELELIGKVKSEYEDKLKIKCTGCAYCMPCPNGVDIPMNFNIYNDYYLFNDTEHPVGLYNHMMPEGQRASSCIECGECLEKCPQEIDIIEELKSVHSLLGRE